jgi:hypothetical protein
MDEEKFEDEAHRLALRKLRADVRKSELDADKAAVKLATAQLVHEQTLVEVQARTKQLEIQMGGRGK